MRITEYKTMINEEKHDELVKVKSFNYSFENNSSYPISPEHFVKMFNDVYSLNKMAEEYVYIIAVNTKMHILGIFEISHGTCNTSFCGAREIFIKLLLSSASNFILIHNHPSGSCYPSKIDIDTYKKIKEIGDTIGIPILDSIIIGEDDYYSFLENDRKV